MKSQRFSPFVGSVMVGLLLLESGGCTYETTDEVYSQTLDSGMDVNMEQANPRNGPKGSAKSVTLTRGNVNPVSCGNQTWGDVGDVYTVQFSITPGNGYPSTPFNATLAYAEIRWTIAGNDVVRTVSIGNGVSVAGVGQGATIKVYDATNVAGSLGFPGLQYDVTATISPGTRGSTVNPPTFVPSVFDQKTGQSSNQLIAPSGNFTYNVPQNVGATSVFITSITPPAATDLGCNVFQMDSAGNTLISWKTSTITDFAPLDPACVTIEVVNNDSSIGHIARVGLFFGIDG